MERHYEFIVLKRVYRLAGRIYRPETSSQTRDTNLQINDVSLQKDAGNSQTGNEFTNPHPEFTQSNGR